MPPTDHPTGHAGEMGLNTLLMVLEKMKTQAQVAEALAITSGLPDLSPLMFEIGQQIDRAMIEVRTALEVKPPAAP